ncbi:small heat shock protein [Phlegmacium glaucopus]|nr:small heat shock protein [Phlegmacium glaucopus]
MASASYEPFPGFGQLFEDGRHIGHGEGDKVVGYFKPRMDLHEDAEKNLVTASFEFPGLSKNDIQISVHNGRLTVRGDTKKSTDSENDEKSYAVRERCYGRFRRTLQLPLGVKEDEIKASMKDGVLNVSFPKATSIPERAPSRIAVS